MHERFQFRFVQATVVVPDVIKPAEESIFQIITRAPIISGSDAGSWTGGFASRLPVDEEPFAPRLPVPNVCEMMPFSLIDPRGGGLQANAGVFDLNATVTQRPARPAALHRRDEDRRG